MRKYLLWAQHSLILLRLLSGLIRNFMLQNSGRSRSLSTLKLPDHHSSFSKSLNLTMEMQIWSKSIFLFNQQESLVIDLGYGIWLRHFKGNLWFSASQRLIVKNFLNHFTTLSQRNKDFYLRQSRWLLRKLVMTNMSISLHKSK